MALALVANLDQGVSYSLTHVTLIALGKGNSVQQMRIDCQIDRKAGYGLPKATSNLSFFLQIQPSLGMLF